MQRPINVVAGCVLGALVVALLASPVCGQGLVERFLTTSPGEKPADGTTDVTIYRGSYYWDEGVDQPNGEIGWAAHNLSVYFPVRKTPTYDVFGYVKGQWLDIDTNAVLPTTGGAFPDDLYDVGGGIGGRYVLSRGWTIGGRLGISSPSDEPYDSWEEINLGADAFLRVPWRQDIDLIGLLSYEKERDFMGDYPMPGFAVHWTINEKLRVLAGVPFINVHWRPLERVDLDLYYTMLRKVDAKVTYKASDRLKVYLGFDWDDAGYWRSGRANSNDELRYNEKRVSLGARWYVSNSFFLDASGGLAFDRFWFEGEDYGDRDNNRIDIDDGVFAMLNVGLRF